MNKKSLYKTLSILSAALTLVVMLRKISPFACCGCPPSGYNLGLISWTLYLNNYLAPVMDCVCKIQGCTRTWYIIPIETILTTFLFGILWIKENKKSSQHRS